MDRPLVLAGIGGSNDISPGKGILFVQDIGGSGQVGNYPPLGRQKPFHKLPEVSTVVRSRAKSFARKVSQKKLDPPLQSSSLERGWNSRWTSSRPTGTRLVPDKLERGWPYLERALFWISWNEAWIGSDPLEREQILDKRNEIAGTRIKLERAGTRAATRIGPGTRAP